MKNYLVSAIVTVLFFLSCAKKDTVPERTETEAKTMMDVSYGSDVRHKMDIYLPANRSTTETKVLVLVHGGGWSGGDKADFNALLPDIKAALPGYAIFNITYRLFANGVNKFPAQEQDVRSAVEFIFNKRSEYVISDKFVFLGASAGGHLVQLQAYKYASPVKPKAVVTFFGPTDLTALFNSNLLGGYFVIAPLLGGTPTEQPSLYHESSPINFVTAQSPPTIMLHGGQDPLVPKAQADMLQTKLQSVNVPNQLIFYPAAGHGWGGDDLKDSFAKISAFLSTHVK